MTLAANGLANAIPFRFTYADATARGAATGFTSADLSSLALQLDNASVWLLTATTPTWTQVGGSTGLTDPTTAKGDLLVRSASAVGRLAVGANNTTLVADSAQTLGVKWAAGVPGSLILIEEWRPADGDTSHNVTIPTTVAEIEWDISGRGKQANEYAGVQIRINGDTGNNYGNLGIFNSGTSSAAAGVNDPTNGMAVGNLSGASATAGRQGYIKGSLSRAQDAVEHTWHGLEMRHTAETPNINMTIVSGYHNAAAAITQITVRTTDGNGFAAGAVIRVYGRLT